MKKLLFICLSASLLTACADKNQYEEAVLAEMKTEQDLKDYKLEPQEMTDCIVDLSSKKMEGIFPFDPNRLMAYRNYTKMITVTQSKDPKQTLIELSKDFGSPKALMSARSNYTESIADCLAAVIMKTEPKPED